MADGVACGAVGRAQLNFHTNQLCLSLNMSGLLACVSCAFRIQYDGVLLSALFSFLHTNAVSLHRCVVVL